MIKRESPVENNQLQNCYVTRRHHYYLIGTYEYHNTVCFRTYKSKLKLSELYKRNYIGCELGPKFQFLMKYPAALAHRQSQNANNFFSSIIQILF